MPNSKKENKQKITEEETLSVLADKRQYLLNGLSELMSQTSGEYGPVLMKELQRRLELVVQNFNDELKDLIQYSFKEWKLQDAQLRDLISSNIGSLQVPKSPAGKAKPADSPMPDFIKDMKFGPKRHK